ncbi:hypothetical protein B0181_05540 [Moraxella caviae]|uniref:Putative manganese efflux pump MntP n=1 Tax=Moraxella caviae TaxID=34060 RepID=A0A1T0A2V1_9GAMM|nr:manganese efflux pump MntP family protein [Moraxella caviae]OOR90106.1 hypothetical protein B0181_05540 [Moraxella caviae]STZ14729.1 putative sporulation protein YtaF [Moraxella caviae]VEW14030.1 putative sporulation protein YtaF [Moraxella caviae]
MNLLSLLVLAFGMSMDAFAVALAKGATERQPHFWQSLKAGAVFGAVEAITPVIGWAIGSAASAWVAQYDHWIAFVLLSFLGARFIKEAFAGDTADEVSASQAAKPKPSKLWLLVLTAFATSIDAMVVGVSLAFMEVNIWLAALLIGMATTIMATIGLYLGNRLGAYFGKRAMLAGGVVLLVIAVSILWAHVG